MKVERTDAHRPSVINPEDYDYVGIWYDPNELVEVGGAAMLQEQREEIRQHMAATQGRWATHEHGGTCHCCGAHAVYLAVFFHQPTKEYIRIGERCTEKMNYGCAEDFASARRSIKDAKAAIAGKRKAEALLSDLGLNVAWNIYNSKENYREYEEPTIQSLVKGLVQYGYLTDKQEQFLRTLLDRVQNRDAIRAQKAAEKALAKDCPEGRILITGEVLATKLQSSEIYGDTLKMLVKSVDGYTVWGTVPKGLDATRGEVVSFKATLKPSDDDPKHGYFSRPSAQKN